MFSWGTRRKLLKLERRFARVEQQIASIASAISHNHQAPSLDAGNLLQIVMEGQGKQITSTSEFIRMIHDIATERMANALGRRGGKARAKTATRDARGRMMPREKVACVLCDDPLTADFSMKEWETHQQHRHRQAQSNTWHVRPKEEEAEEVETHVHSDGSVHAGPDHPAPQYPLPVLDLSHQHEASGPGRGTGEEPPIQQSNGQLVS